MRSSILQKRTSNQALVEQVGEIKFGIFRKTFQLVLSVEEYFPHTIKMRGVKGDFAHFYSEYRLSQINNETTHINWQGKIAPMFFVPPFVGPSLFKLNVRNQFCDVLSEINKRSAPDTLQINKRPYNN